VRASRCSASSLPAPAPLPRRRCVGSDARAPLAAPRVLLCRRPEMGRARGRAAAEVAACSTTVGSPRSPASAPGAHQALDPGTHLSSLLSSQDQIVSCFLYFLVVPLRSRVRVKYINGFRSRGIRRHQERAKGPAGATPCSLLVGALDASLTSSHLLLFRKKIVFQKDWVQLMSERFLKLKKLHKTGSCSAELNPKKET
jgi:hypothetical protein